jgi:hypothetical protein
MGCKPKKTQEELLEVLQVACKVTKGPIGGKEEG